MVRPAGAGGQGGFSRANQYSRNGRRLPMTESSKAEQKEIAMTPEQWWEAVRKESQFWHALRRHPA